MNTDIASQTVKERVDRNLSEATQAQLPGTPFLFINGLPYQSNMDLETLSGIVELFKLENRQYTTCPSMVIDPKKQYEAKMETEKGIVRSNCTPIKPPWRSTASSSWRATGWFNNVTFHRVLPEFRRPGRRSLRQRLRRARLPVQTENTDAKFDRAGLAGDGQLRPGHQRQPVLHHLRRGRQPERRLHPSSAR